MPQRDWFTAVASTTVLLRCLRNFTGCASQNESSFDWPFLCSSAATRWHLSIWQTICSGRQMTSRERDCGQLRLTNWSCAGRDYQRLETAPSASLHLAFGTVCRHASPQHKHCTPSRNIKKLSFLTIHIIYNYIPLCILLDCFYWLCNLSLKLAYGRLNLSFLIIMIIKGKKRKKGTGGKWNQEPSIHLIGAISMCLTDWLIDWNPAYTTVNRPINFMHY